MYTPTTEDVAYWYVGEFDPQSRRAEFDRWLNKVQAEVWEQCEFYWEAAHKMSHREPWEYMVENPYKESE